MPTRKKSPLSPEENISDSPVRCAVGKEHKVQGNNEYDAAWDEAISSDKLNNPNTYQDKSFTHYDLVKMNRKIKKTKAEAKRNREDIKREIQVKAGRKGGQKREKNKIILKAIEAFFKQQPQLKNSTTNYIVKTFIKYTDDEPMLVEVDGVNWDVFYEEEYIISRLGENYKSGKAKNIEKSIKLSTFKAKYIPEAKKRLSNLNQQ